MHSFLSLRGCLDIFRARFPHIKNLRIRSDGAGNFKSAPFVLSLIKLSEWTDFTILELSISEAGGGKDLTDRYILKLYSFHIMWCCYKSLTTHVIQFVCKAEATHS